MPIARIPESEYHSDPWPTPSLSASIAHTLLSRSPAHAYRQHPKLGGKPRADRAEFDEGQLLHKLVLGVGREVTIVHHDSWRTKAAKAERDEIRAAGGIPVLAHKYDAADYLAKTILSRLEEYEIALDGESEMAVLWKERVPSGREVLCRGMLDHLNLPIVYDLKTCQSAHPRACQSHIISYGYDLQAAAYISGIEHEKPELTGRVQYIWLFAEKEPPFLVTPVRFAGSMAQLGTMRWGRALQLWDDCLTRNHWPGYTESVITCEAPQWAWSAEVEADIGSPNYAREDGPTYGVSGEATGTDNEQLEEIDSIF